MNPVSEVDVTLFMNALSHLPTINAYMNTLSIQYVKILVAIPRPTHCKTQN